MPDSKLLIPGNGGITLMDQNGKDLGYPVKMRIGVLSGGLIGKSADELAELLSMEHIPNQWAPNKTSLKSGVSIRPGHALKVAYNQVPKTFNHFLYDWRADIRYTATQLLDYLKERKPAGGRWKVVAHSQGGLLVVLASKMMASSTDFQALVSHVAFVGVPLMGTVNAARALLKGDQMGDDAAPVFRQIIRTWPSPYQILPQWPAVVDTGGTVMDAGKQLLSVNAWTGYAGISADHLQRAKETQGSLQNPLAMMQGVQVRVFMALNRKTSVKLLNDGQLKPKVVERKNGDSLVPYDLTIQLCGANFAQYVMGFVSPCNEHPFLMIDPTVISEVKRFLQ